MKFDYFGLYKYIVNIIFDVMYIVISIITLMMASYIIINENKSVGEGTLMAFNIIYIFIIFSGGSKLIIDMYEYFNVHKPIIEKVCEMEKVKNV